MVSRKLKAYFYFFCGPFMRLNGWFYRLTRAPRNGVVKNYLEGWVNVDANFITAKCDVWADLRNRLPFRDNTVDVIYSHHMIEHLPDTLLPFHFRELYRCLKPGGVFRIGGPHGESAMRKYLDGDAKWFPDFPDKRKSLGGRLVNYIICQGEHLTILTPSYLDELAQSAGFSGVRVCKPKQETNFPNLIDQTVLDLEWETTFDIPHTVIVEGQKEREG
jgi:SAM-dependent methyltransferase